MLAEGLVALAAAGGAAVVQAAGTSAWQGFQEAVARWFGRGDEERERVELERLDRCAAALEGARGGEENERLSISQQGAWQARFEQALETLSDAEREEAARTLRALLDARAPTGGVSAAGDGQAVGGSVDIRADHGSAAARRASVRRAGPVCAGDRACSRRLARGRAWWSVRCAGR
ncbi:hypothetical protein [Streptomyces sp. NPDC051364]|uniref:hypothetical protein n=1 Tax=Streptomyces sp. NPDC051364 TaxID=3155799 RepID=UPI0034284D4D